MFRHSTPEPSYDAESGLLVAHRGPNAGFRRRLDRNVITVGRHPDSDVVLDAVTVSPRHAEFRRDGAGFVVADVGSFNGTYVNGTPIDVAALTDGDEVQIGKFRLVFRAPHPAHGTEAPRTPVIPADPATGSGRPAGDR